jgi:hypothetical protein
MKVAEAKVHWIGEMMPSCGAIFSRPSRWDEQTDDEVWSIVADIGEATGPGELSARIRFLFEEAPQHLLHPGSRFEIFDGATKIAEGEVSSEAVDAPWRPAYDKKAARSA